VSGPAVRGHRVAPFQVQGWNEVTVSLAPEVAAGHVVVLDVTYEGAPVIPGSGINAIAPERVELNVDSGWHPLFTGFDRQLAGTVRLRLPRDWQVVSNAPATWEEGAHVLRNDMAQLDVAFYAAPRLERQAAARFTAYHAGEPEASVHAVLEAAGACATYLDRHYGARRPVPPGRFVLTDRPENAYARTNYFVLSRVDPADSLTLHRFLCHELAHLWTATANPFGPDHWMSEAMAEYVAARYIRERFGQAAFDGLMERWARVAEGQPPVWTPEATHRPSDLVMYRKAPLLLSRLEERIGIPAMDRFLARYMVEDMTATTALLAALAEEAGPDAAAWFRDELAR
jgi:hypothetical protein